MQKWEDILDAQSWLNEIFYRFYPHISESRTHLGEAQGKMHPDQYPVATPEEVDWLDVETVLRMMEVATISQLVDLSMFFWFRISAVLLLVRELQKSTIQKRFSFDEWTQWIHKDKCSTFRSQLVNLKCGLQVLLQIKQFQRTSYGCGGLATLSLDSA